MVTKQLSIAIAISIFVGSGIAVKTFAAAPTSAPIDFDQVFADATRQSQSQYVNRAHKGNRLNVRSVVQETALLPNCEPLASPFADPILGKVVGRCDA
jgi:tetrahydromethanopterin S-methyltransferase subunit D